VFKVGEFVLEKKYSTENPVSFPENGYSRVVIENITPQIDGGRFAIKRNLGEQVVVSADIFADGHDNLSAVLKYRTRKSTAWTEIPMRALGNDHWAGEFVVTEIGEYFYTIEGWVDHFKSWQEDLRKKLKGGLDVALELSAGAALIVEAGRRATNDDFEDLQAWARDFENSKSAAARAFDIRLTQLVSRYPDRRFSTVYEPQLRVVVDPELARFGAWYELFPRSCSPSLVNMAPFGTAKHNFRVLPVWVSMCSTFRQFIRWENRFEKGKTTRSTLNPGIQAARGLSVQVRAAINRSIPNSVLLKISTG